jgi:hypothetical protein
MDQEYKLNANKYLGSVARSAGLGFLRGRDPRVTLAALADPRLLHAAASRLVDREFQIELVIAAAFFIWRLRVQSGIYL